MTFTILPFLVAFMAGLLTMRALDVYQVNAWNVGTATLEAWRARFSSFLRAAARPSDWLRALRWAWPAVAMAAALLLLAHLGVDVGPAALAIAPVSAVAREIREQRNKLIQDAGELMGPNNVFADDGKRTAFDALMADVESLRQPLEDAERNDRLETLRRTTLPESQRTAPDAPERRIEIAAPGNPAYDRAMARYLRSGMGGLGAEERQLMESHRVQLSEAERRDMTTLSAADGGLTVAPDSRFMGMIVQAMKAFGGIELAGAEAINTDTAGPMPINMGDDTGNVGTIVPEAKASGHASGTSPTLTQLVLNGYLYSSKVIKVSWQMLRDPAVDIEAYVSGLLGQRLARAQSARFTSTGTGTGMPRALTSAVTVGRQSAVGFTTSLEFDDVYRTIHSVDPAYRGPKCKFMFSDSSCLVLRLAKDGQGRYLWPEMGNVQTNQPDSLAGYPFIVNNDMPAMAASAKWATFGDHSYYKVRRIRGITMVRINELYVESGQVGFLAFQSADGGYADPGQHPIKSLRSSAT